MKYHFGNVNRVATINFDFEIEPDKLLKKLEKIKWTTPPRSLRSFCKLEPKDRHLKKILNLVKSQKFRLAVLKHLYSLDHKLGEIYGQGGNRDLQWLWNGQDFKTMDQLCGYDAYFVKDKPGYTTELHIDRLGHPFVGIIYLNQTNSDFQTYFYSSKDRTDPFCVEHAYGKGWLQANHVNTWHEGKNASMTLTRYSILFNWGLTPK